MGRLVSVADPAGTITHSLRPDGQPDSIVAPGNVTTSFKYDTYGRRTGMTDPSAGTRTYEYDDSGNIKKETNANDKKTEYEYDTYNRITKRTTPELTTTYAYNADGLLSSVKANNSTSTAYTYDAYGRPSTETDTVPDGKWLKKTYSYSNGNVSSVQYASQSVTITTENYTYACGHLSEIKNGTASIWKLTAENVFGQPTAATTGSISRTYSYDSYGIPTGRKSGVTSGDFQSFTYSFDASNGNLTSRKDNKANKQENLILLII
ncbi:hypothetical protein Barb7_00085 [Bacteroidales bacterium Barb7]|nr:hypothetical protein Barb7_00085 [Bacteroidales bacterium Barb7]